MRHRVFLSFDDHDLDGAKKFRLLDWVESGNAQFLDGKFLDPGKPSSSEDVADVRRKIERSSVTVVLIGSQTKDSARVASEIDWSLEKTKPNAIVGVKLETGVAIPLVLQEYGAEVFEFEDRGIIEGIARAVRQAKKAVALQHYRSVRKGCLRRSMVSGSPEMPIHQSTASGTEVQRPSMAAIELVFEILSDGWQEAISSNLADILTSKVWLEFRSSASSAICAMLAEVARKLIHFQDLIQESVDQVVDRLVSEAGGSRLECKVASELAKYLIRNVAVPGQESLKRAGQALRALGIFICFLRGELARCPCLADIEEEVAQSALKETLRYYLRLLVEEEVKDV